MSDTVPEPNANQSTIIIVVGVAIILGLTVVLIMGVSAVFFDLDHDDGSPPQTQWTLEQTDPPVLMHDGGDAVDCSRIRVTGDLGSGETLCEYFGDGIISEGDSAVLMPINGDTGLLSLTWKDVELNRTITIFEERFE